MSEQDGQPQDEAPHVAVQAGVASGSAASGAEPAAQDQDQEDEG